MDGPECEKLILRTTECCKCYAGGDAGNHQFVSARSLVVNLGLKEQSSN